MRTWFNRHFACVARVIQELRQADEEVPLEFLVSHRHEHFAGYAVADEAFLEPAGLSSEVYLQWVLETVRERQVECIVPGHEQSLLTANTAAIEALGCRVFAAGPAHVLPRIHRKDLVYEDSSALVNLPPYAVCHSPTEARRLVAELEDGGRREVCLKPCVSVYGKGFTRITAMPYRATSWRPLVDHWARDQAAMAVFWPHMVMEFLPGHEYSVDIAARHGTVLAAVTRRKPRTAGGQLLADIPEISEAARRLVSLYSLNGIINVQFRENIAGTPHLLEINPRASGGIGMSCLAGINIPAVAFRGFLEPGWTPPAQRPLLGRRVLEISRAVICRDPDPVPPAWAADASGEKPPRAHDLTVDLPSGRLAMTLDTSSEMASGELLGFGARANSRRGFVLVSKVLGKHWPSRPSVMSKVHRRLAEKLVDGGLDGRLGGSGFVVVGMAETATGLGQGIFEAILDILGPAAHGMALQATRYLPDRVGHDIVEFGEQHSHGPQLVLPLPRAVHLRSRMVAADTLVLCDDEVSTGSTLANLVEAIRPAMPALRRVFVATVADLSAGSCRERILVMQGIAEASVISMLSGSHDFEWNPAFDAGPPPPPSSIGVLPNTSAYSARRGRTDRMELAPEIVDRCLRYIGPGTLPTLVLGTGEFMHPAFRLALAFESRGIECIVQATTRSPLLVAGAIGSVTTVPDVTAGNVPHFLYNFDRHRYRNVFMVHESPAREQVESLCAKVGGETGCVEVDLLQGLVRPWLKSAENCRETDGVDSALTGDVA
jgi:hypothetical protein